MIKFFSTLFISSLFYANTYAQHNHKLCGTVEAINAKNKEIPGYKEAIDDALLKSVERAKMEQGSQKTSGSNYDTTYKIQVVFHIVYSKATENIPDSLILQQLKALNDDFNRNNKDTAGLMGTKPDHKGVASGSNIEFVLATKDPNCKPTTGIVRKPVGVFGFEFNMSTGSGIDNMKFDSIPGSPYNGSSAWDPDRYLNIWVCNLIINGTGNGLLGFAQPPMNDPIWPASVFTNKTKATDGIVLDESCLKPSLFRVLVHEAGHYFSLRHIWGDKSGCSAPGDYVDDTPDADGPTGQGFDCKLSKNTCSESPKPNVEDMTSNYMDYTSNACQNSFTRGQANLMRSSLKTIRTKLAIVGKIKGVETGNKFDNCGVSIQANTNFNYFAISPNPANQNVLVRAELDQQNSPYTISFINEMGQRIYSVEGNESNIERTIDISQLPIGIYHVELSSNGMKQVTKLMKF